MGVNQGRQCVEVVGEWREILWEGKVQNRRTTTFEMMEQEDGEQEDGEQEEGEQEEGNRRRGAGE